MTETYDRQAGLEALTQIFEIDYTPHCAADDAYATMRIAQEMCERDKCTLPELLKKYSIRFGKIENYQFNNSSSNRRNEYLREKSREKRERGEKRARFNDFVYGYRVRPQSQELRGKRFSFSRSIEEEFALAKRLVKEIVKRGGKYSLKLSGCNALSSGRGTTASAATPLTRCATRGRSRIFIRWASLSACTLRKKMMNEYLRRMRLQLPDFEKYEQCLSQPPYKGIRANTLRSGRRN